MFPILFSNLSENAQSVASSYKKQVGGDLTDPYSHRLMQYKLDWTDAQRSESLNTLYEHTVREVQDDIGWYVKDIKGKRRMAWNLRIFTVFFAGLGTIYPILNELLTFEGFLTTFESAIWTTVFLSISAGTLWFDRFFGYSTAWMRYMTTQMLLEKKLDSFEYEWEIDRLKWRGNPPTIEQVQMMLGKAAMFRSEVSQIVQDETNLWVQEFQRALAQLDETMKTQREQQRPGALTVHVINGERAEPWTLYINTNRHDSYTGKSAAISNLSPGFYSIRVEGQIDGKGVQSEGIVMIDPGEAASIQLELPIMVNEMN